MIDTELLYTVSAGPLLIEPGALRIALSALAAAANPERLAAAHGAPASKSSGTVAVIPIQGLIMPKATWMSDLMGWSDLETITDQVNQCAQDSRIKTVLFDVNSPGGSSDGVTECADSIYQLRDSKKTVAISRYSMASAAYWLGSAASTIVAAPLSTTGSIGCWMLHVDQSKALEAEGITATIIKAGKYKVEANPFQALTPEAKEFLTSQVDTTYSAFVASVAKFRGTTPGQVRAGYGEGRSLLDQDAKAAGLVDSVLPSSVLGARLAAGTRVALGEDCEIEASDWAALGFASLQDPFSVEAFGSAEEVWRREADELYLKGLGLS